ncbi:hypothetical protein F5877DRAFT_32910, partial [Lentinula edodes]
IAAVMSPTCSKSMRIHASDHDPHICADCQLIPKIKTFQNALRREEGQAKFTPHEYRNKLLGEAHLKHRDVLELLNHGKDMFIVFARRALEGRYDGMKVLTGLLQTAVVVEERQRRGKGLQNMSYPVESDEFMITLALTSSRAYNLIQQELGGRTLRSIKHLQSKNGRYQPGIVGVNFDKLAEKLQKIGYDGPLALAVDDTKLVPALRAYKDGNVWKMAGMHEHVYVFDSYDQLVEMRNLEQKNLAEKVRCWNISIPIPGLPSIMVATLGISSTVQVSELRRWHDEIQSQLLQRGLDVISYSVDGAQTERSLGHDLEWDFSQANGTKTWTFYHPGEERKEIQLIAPLLPNGKPQVVCSDGKHLKKNRRGSATSGARGLALGRYQIHFGILATIALGVNTPLLKTDIIGVDKQDDRAAARLFPSAVIAYLSKHLPDELGTAIYLFIVGEIVDAQQNCTVSHREHMKMLWRGRFFLEGWRSYVLSHLHYNINTHFITRELYDIITVYIDAMLKLILIHRDYFPHIPFYAWFHSTEPCEHRFGCSRGGTGLPNFTFTDWILMSPKVDFLMYSAIKHQQGTAVNGHRAGYLHTYLNNDGATADTASKWPSDSECQEAINIGFVEAQRLLDCVGITWMASSASIAQNLQKTLAAMSKASETDEIYETLEDIPTEELLTRILDKDGVENDDSKLILPHAYEKVMAEHGAVAAAAIIHDNIHLYVSFSIVLSCLLY